jgi:hypothetical protein
MRNEESGIGISLVWDQWTPGHYPFNPALAVAMLIP